MQSLLKQDFFELFRLSPGFALDTAELASRYRELQQVVHPDRYASASEQDRRLSMQNAAHVNEAYQTLRHPLSRARYLLQLRGLDTDGSAAMPADFLMEQMSLREQLETALTEEQPQSALVHLGEYVQQKISDLEQAFADLMAQVDNAPAVEVFNKLQFLYRLLEEIDAREEQLSG